MDINDGSRFICIVVHVLNAYLLFEVCFEADVHRVDELGRLYANSLVKLMSLPVLIHGYLLIAVLVLFNRKVTRFVLKCHEVVVIILIESNSCF